MKAFVRLFLAMIALVAMCVSAIAQENTAGYWLKEGHELYTNDSFEQAAQAYDKAIQIDPKNASAWLGKGDSLKVINKNDEALVALNKTLDLDPQNADAWASKGYIFSNMWKVKESGKAYEMAVQLYDEKLKNDPHDVDAWLSKGMLSICWL